MSTTLNVQFNDSTGTTVVAYFGAPQDSAYWPNQAQIESTDSRWASFYNALPKDLQEGLPSPDVARA